MKFSDFNKNKSVITTSYVVKDRSPVVYIFIDEELDIQAFSEEGAVMENAAVISVDNLLSIDSSIATLPDFEKGDKFYRTDKSSIWQKVK